MQRTKLGITRPLAIILIYLFQLIGGIFFLITDRSDRDIRYHARMSCLLCLTEIVSVVLFRLLAPLPLIGWLFTMLLWVVTIAYIGIMLLAMLRALNGAPLRLPFFHDLASK